MKFPVQLKLLVQKQKDLFIPLMVVGVNRLLLFFVVYLGLRLVPLVPKPEQWRAFPNNLFLDGWARWDSGWYFAVVDHGYFYIPHQASTVPFFPLYPFFIKLGMLLLKNVALSGIVVANLCFVIAMIMLYKLVKDKLGPRTAFRTLLFFSLYPFSFFFSAAYAESLFLLLVVLCFYWAEKGKWGLVSIAGLLCSATKSIGLFLFPVLVVHYLQQNGFKPGKIKKDLLWLFLVPIGFLSYAVYLWVRFGDPLLIYHAYGAWGRHLFNFGTYKKFNIHSLVMNPGIQLVFCYLILAAIFLFLIAAVKRRLGLSYAFFSLSIILVDLISDPCSIGRHLNLVFPVFVVFATEIRTPLLRYAIYVLSALSLTACAFAFSHWGWIV